MTDALTPHRTDTTAKTADAQRSTAAHNGTRHAASTAAKHNGARHENGCSGAASSEPSVPTVSGLAGIIVADTRISEVDGERGMLIIAGEHLQQLAERGFEGACAKLWTDELAAEAKTAEPSRTDETDVAGAAPGKTEARTRAQATAAQRALGDARVAVFAERAYWQNALEQRSVMAAVRAGLAQLPLHGLSWEQTAWRLCAGAAVMLACHQRKHHGQPLLAPDPSARHSHDFLRLLTGQAPSEAQAQALDRYLCTVIDHGFNASTFAARVVASTGADMLSAVLAAFGALSGPLHGGAPGPVLDMLDAIGQPERAEVWLRAELAAGRRIMGMGHRVYRVRDPRAAVLQHALERMSPNAPRLQLARHVEQQAEALLQKRYPGRSLRANVEMYTALLLEGLGLHRELFTPVFAMARCAGWCAHYAEERARGRLIRPRARYIGPRPTSS